MKSNFLLLFCIFFFLSGCASLTTRTNKQLSILVYSQQDAIKKGRIDKVNKLNSELIKLVSPPKKNEQISIAEFRLSWDKPAVVLPSFLADRPIVIEDSLDFKKTLEQDKVLQKEENRTNQELEKTSNKVNTILIDKQKQLEKQEKTNWFSKLFRWFLGLGISGMLITIVLVMLCPALLPLVLTIIKSIFSMIKYIVFWFISVINSLYKK